MSKISEAKEKQGFVKNSPQCQNCIFFESLIEKVKNKWHDTYHTKESNLRCTKGGFKVMKTTYCREHEEVPNSLIDK